MKKNYLVKSTGALMMVVALASLLAIAPGCGGGGSSVSSSYTVSGTVQMPNTTTGSSRVAAAMAAATGTVQIVSVSGTGTETTVVSGITTDSSGQFSAVISSSYPYETYDLVAKAVVRTPTGATATIRAHVTSTTANLTPITEAAYQLIQEKLVLEGKTYADLSSTEIQSINSAVSTAVGTSVDNMSGTYASIVSNAKNNAAFNTSVQSTLNSSLDETASAVNYIVMANTPSGWSETTGDFSYMALTGSATAIPVPTYGFLNPNPVNSDVAISVDNTYTNYVYVLNRYNYDTVVVLNPATGFSVAGNYSLKGNSTDSTMNPLDIQVVSATKAYVTLYEKDYMLIINPTTGSRTGTISLANYAHQFGSGDTADTIPEMSRMVMVGTKVFVAVQNLDRTNSYATSEYAKVVVIDTATDSPVQSIDLNTDCGQNPNSELVYANSKIYVTCAGNTMNPTGTEGAGIASIDPTTYAITKVASKADGDFACAPGSIAIASATKGYFSCMSSWPTSSVYSFNPSTGDVNSTAVHTGSLGFSMGIDQDGNLVVPSRDTSAPGLYFYNTSTDQKVYASPVSVGLMPEAFAFFTSTP